MRQSPANFFSSLPLILVMAFRRTRWGLVAGVVSVAVLLILLIVLSWPPSPDCTLPQTNTETVAFTKGQPLSVGWSNGTVFPFQYHGGWLYGSCDGSDAATAPYLSGYVAFNGCNPCNGSVAVFNSSGWWNESHGVSWSPTWLCNVYVPDNHPAYPGPPCTSIQNQSVLDGVTSGSSPMLYAYIWSNVTATLDVHLTFYWGM